MRFYKRSALAAVAAVSLLLAAAPEAQAKADAQSWKYVGNAEIHSKSWKQTKKSTIRITVKIDPCTFKKKDGSEWQAPYVLQLQKKSGVYYDNYANVRVGASCNNGPKNLETWVWTNAPKGKYRFHMIYLEPAYKNPEKVKFTATGNIYFNGAKP